MGLMPLTKLYGRTIRVCNNHVRPDSNVSALISGTISFLLMSIRHTLELSTTRVPTAANFGAHSNEVYYLLPRIMLISGAAETACSNTFEWYPGSTSKLSFVLPTLFSEATGINSATGKLLSAKTFKMICPTIPVSTNYCNSHKYTNLFRTLQI